MSEGDVAALQAALDETFRAPLAPAALDQLLQAGAKVHDTHLELEERVRVLLLLAVSAALQLSVLRLEVLCLASDSQNARCAI